MNQLFQVDSLCRAQHNGEDWDPQQVATSLEELGMGEGECLGRWVLSENFREDYGTLLDFILNPLV